MIILTVMQERMKRLNFALGYDILSFNRRYCTIQRILVNKLPEEDLKSVKQGGRSNARAEKV